MSFPGTDLAASFPWPLAGSLACALHAYSTVLGNNVDGLLLLGALGLQARPQVTSHLAAAADYIMVAMKTADIPVSTSAVIAGLLSAVSLGLLARVVFARAAPADPWTGSGKPMLFPCTTTHTRKFPEKHSFVYSYLVVGIPVGWSGVSGGGMISMTAPGELAVEKQRKGWFHVDAGDYLERGSSHLGLRGKMDAHLRDAHGIDPAAYPHAYLVTAARFLGYHFNPVSFWYLYDANKTLAAMILEVNNTFGERHMYFLTREMSADDKVRDGTAKLFKQKWPKDFHVSPFNSRQGSYELLANDPLAPSMEGTGPLSATLVLRSSQDHSKIVASLTSERRGAGDARPYAFDPAAMSVWQRTVFIASWFWVGFVTFPRIVRQAGTLFFSKRLQVWFRPEPLARSMSRVADDTEQKLEVVFRQYLRHLVETSNNGSPLAVKYVPCGVVGAVAETFSNKKDEEKNDIEQNVVKQDTTEIEFRVLTPVFYTRFVHYAHDVEALFCELRESCTVSISPPSAAAVFTKQVLARAAPPAPLEVASPIDYVMFSAIRKLRQRPGRLDNPAVDASDSSTSSFTSSDVRGFRLSAMDGFALSLREDEAALHKTYRSTVLKLFIADRTALGMVAILQAQVFVVRAAAAWVVARVLLRWL